MTFASHCTYVESGVAWLGRIPSHWRVFRLKDIAKVINGYPFDSKLFEVDGTHPLIRIRDLNAQETAMRYSGEFVAGAAVTSADVLIGMDGEFNVGRWLGEAPALLNQRMCCVRTSNRALSQLLLHALPIPLKAINDVTYSTTVKHLSSLDVEKLRIALPNTDELAAIAAFLDHETAKIDGLIAEQEKLIALLAEKRQATISDAVTRGLNPQVPMKDSGVPWLGEVPAHWKVLALRRVIAAIEQGWSPECHAREADATEWGVLKAGCLNGGVFRPSENKALPPELAPEEKYEVHAGDVLMSRASGSPELVGSTALVAATRPGLMLSDKIFRLHLQGAVMPRYFVAAMGSLALRTQVENALSGGNGMANNLPQSSLLAFLMTVPPRDEQQAIVDFIDTEVGKLDSLGAESERAIALLRERRSALIAAAVTGQIDVRGLAPAPE